MTPPWRWPGHRLRKVRVAAEYEPPITTGPSGTPLQAPDQRECMRRPASPWRSVSRCAFVVPRPHGGDHLRAAPGPSPCRPANPYSYVNGNPVNLSDPTGHSPYWVGWDTWKQRAREAGRWVAKSYDKVRDQAITSSKAADRQVYGPDSNAVDRQAGGFVVGVRKSLGKSLDGALTMTGNAIAHPAKSVDAVRSVGAAFRDDFKGSSIAVLSSLTKDTVDDWQHGRIGEAAGDVAGLITEVAAGTKGLGKFMVPRRGSTGATSAVAAARLAEDLAAAQLANPLIDSLRATGSLPFNYVTKSAAAAAGWSPGKALDNYVPGGQLGGDVFKNPADIGLPTAPGRTWREADIGLSGSMSRAKQPGTRLLYSNDGMAYVSPNHYGRVYQILGGRNDGGHHRRRGALHRG